MTGKINKILIANRGEIACRIIRTAGQMNIATVAVYSDADRNAMHVEMADEAVHIGPSAVAESYLQGDKIISAALETGTDAIHPGYGFLSENPEFIEAVEAAGLVFIGPTAKAVRAMGLKDAAKTLMEKAGVPVVPGYHGERQEPDFLAAEADKIGYPVLIKARAGGGGKGMRLVENPEAFAAALEGAQREGHASFGDGRVLIEKYITSPRHIEVQVFGDSHGNVVHLFERDCSLQRRHQKVIEEAPAPGMTEEMRRAMTEAAVKAAQAINYSGAGTIEFIVDGSETLRPDHFWFMEMNTRLQVEHPVTELVTGLDLVEWQIRVAAGEHLPKKQGEIALSGHAFEARLYAEDVPKGFLPATGTIHHLELPDTVRIDTGVRKGTVISPWYDPMIAKVISAGETREKALGNLNAALRQIEIGGTVTNLDFLEKLSSHSGFAAGEMDTGLIERHRTRLLNSRDLDAQIIGIAAIIVILSSVKSSDCDPFSILGSFCLWGNQARTIRLGYQGDIHDVVISTGGEGAYRCHSDFGNAEMLQCGINKDEGRLMYVSNGKQKSVSYGKWSDGLAVFLKEKVEFGSYEFMLPDPLDLEELDEASSDSIFAPMPGLVKKLSARAGDKVTKGEQLVVLEAMKMEHTLSAPRDGVLAEVLVGEGDQVEDGSLLVALEEEE